MWAPLQASGAPLRLMATTAAWKRPRKAASRMVRPTRSEPARGVGECVWGWVGGWVCVWGGGDGRQQQQSCWCKQERPTRSEPAREGGDRVGGEVGGWVGRRGRGKVGKVAALPWWVGGGSSDSVECQQQQRQRW